jgi:hypothetical protein
MSDAELETLCRENDNLQFERTKEGGTRMYPVVSGKSICIVLQRITDRTAVQCGIEPVPERERKTTRPMRNSEDSRSR